MSSNKINILVVDDRVEGIYAVSAVLDSPEYNLVTASSGNAALKHLLQDDFAVILLDVQMPIMNGFEVATIIKTRTLSRDIPIIFMSAINQDEQYVYQGYKAGAVDYLLKPFDPYILRSKVAIFVDIFKKNKLIKEQAKQLYKTEVDKIELESLKSYRYLADSIPQIVFRLVLDGSHQYFNKVWFEYTGFSDDQSLHMNWKNAIHPEDLSRINALLEQSHNKDGLESECRILNKNGHFRWHLVRIQPENTAVKKSWLGTATDIEDQKKMEEGQRFLAKAGEILLSSLDPKIILQSICKLSIPYLSDWTAFDLVNSEGTLKNFVIDHKNPEKREEIQKLHEFFLEDSEGQLITSSVLEAEKTKIFDSNSNAAFKFSETSLVIIPLIANGHKLGTFTYGITASNTHDQFNVQLAEELARRIALSFENSRLYQISQKAIELRNDFLSIASHELNTPITSLKFQLQILQKTLTKENDKVVLVDKFSKSLTSSIKQVDRLINLVQVLLDVSYIQSGKLMLAFEEFDICEVVDEVIERHKELLKQSHCQLELHSPSNVIVVWDRTRTEQIIVNLLTNAIKYAPGKIKIFITKDEAIKIEIADQGKGIPLNKLDFIFQRFERASSNLNISGLGLGLYIVKQIVEGHKGSIEVKSEENKGSCFILTMPQDATVASSFEYVASKRDENIKSV